MTLQRTAMSCILLPMRVSGTLRLLVALACSWQTAYQICDRYGDAFREISASASFNSKTISVVAPGGEDLDACMPLTLGRVLLPGRQDLLPRPEVVHQFADAPGAYCPRATSIGLLGRAPPCRKNTAFDPPPQRLLFLALAAVGSLAPPAV